MTALQNSLMRNKDKKPKVTLAQKLAVERDRRRLKYLRRKRQVNREVYQGLRSSDPATVRRAKRRVDGWLRTTIGGRTRAPGRRTRTP